MLLNLILNVTKISIKHELGVKQLFIHRVTMTSSSITFQAYFHTVSFKWYKFSFVSRQQLPQGLCASFYNQL